MWGGSPPPRIFFTIIHQHKIKNMATPTQDKSKKNSSFFRLHVRPDAQKTKVQIGFVKNNEFIGTPYDAIATPPAQWIPNHYQALVIKDESEGKYKGKFKWADSMDEEGAVMIDIRYLSSCSSLDAKWQVENGFKPKDEIEEVGWEYPQGEIQEFDSSRIPKLLKEFFEHHQGNGDNPLRDRENSIMFRIVNPVAKVNDQKARLEKEENNLKIRKSIMENDSYVECLSQIFNISPRYEMDVKRSTLGDKFEADTEGFKKIIKDYIAEQKAGIAKALKKGLIVITDGAVTHKNEAVTSLAESVYEDDVKDDVIALDIASKMTEQIEVKGQLETILKQL